MLTDGKHSHYILKTAPTPPAPLQPPPFLPPPLISIVTVQSCQSFSPRELPHSPPVKLPGGFPVTGWQGGAAVGPACLCEMFIWSGELTGLTAHPHRAFVMWFKPPCRLSQAPLYSPIQMKVWDWLSLSLSFFLANLHAIAETKQPHTPTPRTGGLL